MTPLAPTIQEQRKMLLAQKRAVEKGVRTRRGSFQNIQKQIRALKRSLPPKITFVEAFFMIMIAFSSDVFDWLIIGSIPILGDVVDLATWMVIGFWVWWRRLKRPPLSLAVGAIEFIPGFDIVPTWTAMVVGIIAYNQLRRMMHFRKIRRVKLLQKQARRLSEAPL